MTVKVLFVYDDKEALSSLKRLLYDKRDEWHMDFISDPRSTLDLIKKEHYDVVVTDINMPLLNGIVLLKKIKEEIPSVYRIAISGYDDMKLTKEILKIAHKFFHKPYSKDRLEKTINKMMVLKEILPNKDIREKLNDIEILPTHPLTYAVLIDSISKSDINEFKKILYYDGSMFINLYKINSFFVDEHEDYTVFFKLLHNIDISFLKRIFLSREMFSSHEEFIFKDFSVNEIWRHSKRVAFYAKEVSQQISRNVDFIVNCFTSALLHDIGKYLMLLCYKDKYLNFLINRNFGYNVEKEEDKIFNCNHSIVGAYLAGLWGANSSIIEAIAFHERPSLIKKDSISPLSIIHFVNYFDRKTMNVKSSSGEVVSLDFVHYKNINFDGLDNWYKICEMVLNSNFKQLEKDIL